LLRLFMNDSADVNGANVMSVVTLGAIAFLGAVAGGALNAGPAVVSHAQITDSAELKSAPTVTGCLSGVRTSAELYRVSPPDRDRKRDGPQRHRIQIGGGLLPSATIAAQAGALDPGRAAVIALSENLETDRLRPLDLSEEPPILMAIPPVGRCR
jgi:hypothetical protein